MSTLSFTATLFQSDETGSATLLALPQSASAKLPSRGMTLVEGTLNDFPVRAVLEPDGKGSHWFKVNEAILEAIGKGAGDTVTMVVAPSKEWPEPTVPPDLKSALASDNEAQAQWEDITSMARWDWIRWIGAAKQSETRKRRVENACSMLKAGKRRVCCFDRNQCTLTDA
jgi:hypothetical protein